MQRNFKIFGIALVFCGFAVLAMGFSLLGPRVEQWQIRQHGHDRPGDIGGPMNIDEGYRWNIPEITYAFDESFIGYFGSNGVIEITKAIAILNGVLTNGVSQLNIDDFPFDAQRENYTAKQLGITDLKSETLSVLLEEMGLAAPERYVFTIFNRVATQTTTNWLVIQRNFDPEYPYQESRYINGKLYDYNGFIEIPPPNAEDFPNTYLVDRLAYPFISTVAGRGISAGEFYTGLTRDDVGGLRYLLRPDWINFERLVPGTQEVFTNFNDPIIVRIHDLGLLVRESNGTTNTPAQLQALFPGIEFASTNAYFTNLIITNITSYFTNFPYALGAPMEQVFVTNYVTDFLQVFDYTYSNVITNEYFPSRLVTERQYEIVPAPNYTPNGSSIQTNLLMEITYNTSEPSGSFYILPSNLLGIEFTTNMVTTVTNFTNTVQTIFADVVAVTNNTGIVTALTTLDYHALYTNSVGTTNTATTLLGLPGYEDLLILHTNSYLGTVVTTNITSYFKDYPWRPEQIFVTNYSTNVVTLFDYTLGNIVVDPYFHSSFGRPIDVRVLEIYPADDYSPGLGGARTNILEEYTDRQFVENGEFFIVPTNLLGYAYNRHVHTEVTATTNIDFMIFADLVLRTNNDQATYIITTDLMTFSEQARTNSPAELLSLYTNLLILSSERNFTLEVETNFISFFTNFPWDPAGSLTLTQQQYFQTNAATNWVHVFGNVVTNFGSTDPIPSNGFMIVEENIIGYNPYSPAGSPAVTNTTVTTIRTNFPVGNIYIVNTNLFGYSLRPDLFFHTDVVALTNTVILTNIQSNVEQTNTIHFIRYETNYWVGAYPIEILSTNDLLTNIFGIRQEFVTYATNNTYEVYPIEMVTAEDFTNRLFGSRHEIVTYYTNSLVTAYAVETRAPFYNAAKRGGVDKITFRPLFGESVFTTNSIFTNTYLDTVYILTNGVEMEMQQTLRRVMRGPDILFAAADFPRPGGTVLAPPILTRTSAGTQAAPVWDNGSDINGDPNRAGPGVILPRVTITFNKLGIQIINSHSGTTYFLDRDIPDFVWGSFDGTTNAPIIYPVGSSFSDLESQVLGSP